MRIRGKREAEREAHHEKAERDWQENVRALRTTGDYHDFGIEPWAGQSVCHKCSAVVADRDVHTAWHNEVLTGNALADVIDRTNYGA
ncbi:MAG TPA: hypothetical protein VFV01_16905 [Spirillospora sp.]|nr:hypothetical protein [Spirillospora sp.]